MKTIRLLALAVLLASAAASASAAPAANQKPQVIIIVDYTPETPPGKQHIFRSVCEYLRYFGWRRFCPNWP